MAADLAVAHALPGRLRLRASAADGDAGAANRAAAAAARLPGVRAARFRPVTGSLLIEYDPRATDERAVLAGIRSTVGAEIDRPAPPSRSGPASPGRPRAEREPNPLDVLVPAAMLVTVMRRLAQGHAGLGAWLLLIYGALVLWQNLGALLPQLAPGRHQALGIEDLVVRPGDERVSG